MGACPDLPQRQGDPLAWTAAAPSLAGKAVDRHDASVSGVPGSSAIPARKPTPSVRFGIGLRNARRRRPRRLPLSLFWRVFVLNAALLIGAGVVLAVSPATISFPVRPHQLFVLTIGLVVLLVANALLLRISLAPLRELARLMRRIDLLMPGERLDEGGAGELRTVIGTFNEMLARLEWERRSSSSRTVGGQEEERRQIARELHDEVGQGLTAVLLQLKTLAADAPDTLQPGLANAQTVVRGNLDEVRRIARQLRPTVLDDLGLAYAVHSLLDVFEETGPLTIEREIMLEMPTLPPAVELALFRIAQESLTNVLRHANATRVTVALRAIADERIELVVSDNGRGMVYAADLEGGGIRGMRERTLAVDARLQIRSQPGKGTDVSVTVPVGAR
jgi:two-component system sensor histidine kinase UhpB